MRYRSVLLAACLAWPALASAADCRQAVLEQLGWQFERVPARAEVHVHGGPVCDRADLAQAQAGGDLRVQIPATLSPARHDALMQQLLQHPATVCAYGFQLGAAARRAAQALQDNPGYRFSGLQMGWIGFGLRGSRAQGWQRTRSFGRGYQPAGSNSRAVDAFYAGTVRSECGVGRQVAQLATQRELYGDAAFDQAFTAQELSIGTFIGLHDTDSILLGHHAGTMFGDGKAVRTAAMGRQAFMGVPGYLVHAFDAQTLDDLNNQAENFIVVDVGPQAAQQLRSHGGFAYYDARNRELWALSRQVPRRGVAFFERLLVAHDPRLRAALQPEQADVVARMDALLADPFYQQFLIYSHPRGIKPIGAHVARLLDRNPRTPYEIELTRHNLHTTLYQRWLQSRLQQCQAAQGARRPVSVTARPAPHAQARVTTQEDPPWTLQ